MCVRARCRPGWRRDYPLAVWDDNPGRPNLTFLSAAPHSSCARRVGGTALSRSAIFNSKKAITDAPGGTIVRVCVCEGHVIALVVLVAVCDGGRGGLCCQRNSNNIASLFCCRLGTRLLLFPADGSAIMVMRQSVLTVYFVDPFVAPDRSGVPSEVPFLMCALHRHARWVGSVRAPLYL